MDSENEKKEATPTQGNVDTKPNSELEDIKAQFLAMSKKLDQTQNELKAAKDAQARITAIGGVAISTNLDTGALTELCNTYGVMAEVKEGIAYVKHGSDSVKLSDFVSAQRAVLDKLSPQIVAPAAPTWPNQPPAGASSNAAMQAALKIINGSKGGN